MADSGQFLTVPSTRHRSSQHHRRDSARASAQSPRSQRSAARGVASSSKVKLEDTPLGMSPASPGPPPSPPPSTITTTSTTTKADINDTTITTSSSSSSSSPHSSRRTSQAQRQARPAVATSSPPNIASPPPNPNASSPTPSVQLSPRSIFRAMPFLLRLRSPPSDLMTMTCTSGGPRTHAVLSKCQIDRASQALTYNKTIVCADAVNAEVLLRLARNELLERAQEANRQVTALVDEEYVSLFNSLLFSQSAQHEKLTINSDRLGGGIPSGRARAVIITSRYVAHSPVHQAHPYSNRMAG